MISVSLSAQSLYSGAGPNSPVSIWPVSSAGFYIFWWLKKIISWNFNEKEKCQIHTVEIPNGKINRGKEILEEIVTGTFQKYRLETSDWKYSNGIKKYTYKHVIVKFHRIKGLKN